MPLEETDRENGPTVDADARIVRAVGEELRRARDSVGWSRPELVKRMHSHVPVNTYACYEQGIRQCSIPRLVEICRALGVAAPELLGLALQRVDVDLDIVGVRVDLHKVASDDRDELEPFRRWGENRLKIDIDGSGVVRLDWILVQEMAVFFGRSVQDLVALLKEFAPESAPQR